MNTVVSTQNSHDAPMTPAKEAKLLGLKSLTAAYSMTGENRYYFAYLHKTKPLVFKAVIMGLVSQQSKIGIP